MTDQNHLDGFLESAGIPADTTVEETSTTTETTTTQTEEAPEQTGQPRDEAGRFASTTVAETPAEVPQTETQPQTHQSDRTVPVDVLTAIRGENRELKQQIQQLTTAMQTLQLQRPQPAQAPAQQLQAEQPKEFWDDPDGFVGTKLTPLQQQLAETRAQVSHFAAVAEFGKETVTAAHEAINEAIGQGQLDRAEVNKRLSQSRDPVGDIVRWHQDRKARDNMQRIGGDPDAWLAAELEKRMADPAFQAQVIERARGSTQPNGQSSQTPLTQLPPSLSKLPGANAAVEVDGSSEGLFRHAMGAR